MMRGGHGVRGFAAHERGEILCETVPLCLVSLDLAHRNLPYKSITTSTGQWSDPYISVWMPALTSFSSKRLEVRK